MVDPPPPPPPVLEPPISDPPVKDPPEKPPIDIPPVDPGVKDPPVKDPPVVHPPDSVYSIRTHTQEQIINALRDGRFCVTDGPAIRIAIARNDNDVIDDEDIQMGSVFEFSKPPAGPLFGQTKRVLVECLSTVEFGPISKIDLYVGVHPGASPRSSAQARVYAPLHHGVRDNGRDPSGGNHPGDDIFPGEKFTPLSDGYWEDDRLRAVPPPGALTYTASFELNLDSYEAGAGVPVYRFFVRAFAATSGDFESTPRYALTNPIWLLRSDLDTQTGEITLVPTISVVPRTKGGGYGIKFSGTLQFSPGLDRPFVDVPGAISPYSPPAGHTTGFFRTRE